MRPEGTLLLFSLAATSSTKLLGWRRALSGDYLRIYFGFFRYSYTIPRKFSSDFSTSKVVQYFCFIFKK